MLVRDVAYHVLSQLHDLDAIRHFEFVRKGPGQPPVDFAMQNSFRHPESYR